MIEERPGAAREAPFERLARGLRDDDDVRALEVDTEAARPSRSPRGWPPASSSKKSLIRFFSVSCSITWTFLIPTATWLATARPSSTRSPPSATRSPMSSSLATSGIASRAPCDLLGQAQAELSEAERLARTSRLGIARAAVELFRAGSSR